MDVGKTKVLQQNSATQVRDGNFMVDSLQRCYKYSVVHSNVLQRPHMKFEIFAKNRNDCPAVLIGGNYEMRS